MHGGSRTAKERDCTMILYVIKTIDHVVSYMSKLGGRPASCSLVEGGHFVVPPNVPLATMVSGSSEPTQMFRSRPSARGGTVQLLSAVVTARECTAVDRHFRGFRWLTMSIKRQVSCARLLRSLKSCKTVAEAVELLLYSLGIVL